MPPGKGGAHHTIGCGRAEPQTIYPKDTLLCCPLNTIWRPVTLTTLDQNEAELGVLVLFVTIKMLADGNCLLDEVIQVLRL